jgi:K+-transporting ATPase ATPase C chain
MLKQLMPAIRATLVLAVITGLLFPLAITGLAQVMFREQANGSLVQRDGVVVGSRLLGQGFSRPEYYHPRPSAAGSGYAGEASGGTNLGPTSAKLLDGQPDDPKTKDTDESFAGVKQLVESYRQENHLPSDAKVPVDAVTRSGSGLDPQISQANALLQARRVAAARGKSPDEVTGLIRRFTEERDLGVLGEPRVNVLLLNLELDKQFGKTSGSAPAPNHH